MAFAPLVEQPQHLGIPIAEDGDSQLRADEALARRLQQEENGGGGGPGNEDHARAPLLERRAAVRQNIGSGLYASALEHSRRYVICYLLWAFCETITTIVIVSLTWNKPCDRHLQTWCAVFSSRFIVLVPLTIRRYVRRHHPQLNDSDARLKGWINCAFFLWFILGQMWVYHAETCPTTAPLLYKYSFALVISVFVSLAFPLVVLLMLFLCMPCVILLLRFFAPNPGASNSVIRSLPTTKFRKPQLQPGEEAPSCAVCLSEFEEGNKLRTLPCQHNFHLGCVDPWLTLHATCPLCRTPVE